MTEIKPLTQQEIFDNAVNGIAGQDFAPATGDDGVCRCYVEKDGKELRCALAHSLPLQKAKDHPQAYPIAMLFPLRFTDKNATEPLERFAAKVQLAHDTKLAKAPGKDGWVQEMYNIAVEFKLNPESLDKAVRG